MQMKIRIALSVLVAALCLGATCRSGAKHDAKATVKPGSASPVPDAIATARSEAQAALDAVEKRVAAANAQLAALEKRSAIAAAQVQSIRTANTNQPPSPATSVVAGEASLALGNLPTPDVTAALEAEKRRSAMLAGHADDARKLYASAQGEAERMRSEAAKLKSDATEAKAGADAARAKADQAQVALIAAEKANTAALERNRAANQALLDAAEKRADEAVKKAYEERQNIIVRILMGIGALAILAGIGLAIATSGASAIRSGIAVLCGGICFGLARVLSHPLFNVFFVAALAVTAIAVSFYLWRERRESIMADGYIKTVDVLERVNIADATAKDSKGEASTIAGELSKLLDTRQKAIVNELRRVALVRKAKTESRKI